MQQATTVKRTVPAFLLLAMLAACERQSSAYIFYLRSNLHKERVAALETLKELGPEALPYASELVEMYLEFSELETEEARETARGIRYALTGVLTNAGPESVPILRRLLDHRSDVLQTVGVLAVLESRAPPLGAVCEIARTMEPCNRYTSGLPALALGRHARPELLVVLPDLVSVLLDHARLSDRIGKLCIYRALGRLGPGALPALAKLQQEAARTENPHELRIAALEAVSGIGGRDRVRPFLHDPALRAAARRILELPAPKTGSSTWPFVEPWRRYSQWLDRMLRWLGVRR